MTIENIPINIYEDRKAQRRIGQILHEMFFEDMMKDLLESSERLVRYTASTS